MIPIGKADINGFLVEHKTVSELTQELMNDGWVQTPNQIFIKWKLVGGIWVEGATPQEIDDAAEAEEKQTVAQLLAQFENDGKAFFHEIRVLVMYYYNKGTISEVQFNAIKDILRPAIAPLLIGEWDQAQINIDALNRPSGVLGNLYDFVKTGIDTYLT